jgi:hypothetical protein
MDMSVLARTAIEEAGLTHVSPSSLNRFLRCPENYRQRYLLKNPDPAGPKALLGAADSRAFELYYLSRIGGLEGLPLDVVTDAFRDAVVAQDGDFDLEDETTDSLIDIGVPTIRAYYDVARKMPDPIAVEQKIKIERDSLPVPIIGYTDVEFEGFGIDRKGAANKSVHPDWRLQARIYSAAQAKPWGFHVTTRTKTPAVYTPDDGDQYQEPWSEARAQKTIRMVGQTIARIESSLLMFGTDEPWDTLPGFGHTWACGKCPYKKGCPAWS